MIEICSDLWDYTADCRVITTNGSIKRNGQAVMGRGIAAQAAIRYPELPLLLSRSIKKQGNHLYMLGDLCMFPVKHNWWEQADILLIQRSAEELAELANMYSSKVFASPRPGCGNGGLLWRDVKPILESILPVNVHIVDSAN